MATGKLLRNRASILTDRSPGLFGWTLAQISTYLIETAEYFVFSIYRIDLTLQA